MKYVRLSVLLAAAAALGACGDELHGTTGGGGSGGSGGAPPTDIAGDYSITLTNGENGCMLQNWMAGAVTKDVAFTITQDMDAKVVGNLGGAAALYADLVLGSHTFKGEVTGDAFTMTDYGTQQGKMNNCSYTFNAVMEGTINGDAVEGKVHYKPQTNMSPDCGVLNDCTSDQAFNGTRPPK